MNEAGGHDLANPGACRSYGAWLGVPGAIVAINMALLMELAPYSVHRSVQRAARKSSPLLTVPHGPSDLELSIIDGRPATK
jgi:hypothetical protein